MGRQQSITIRLAAPDDSRAIERLAQLLVADVDGELWAAVELGCGTVVADPFRPSGDVAEFLLRRFERLNGGVRRGGVRRWLARGRVIPCRT